jgi:hypothetical protein
MPECQIGSFRPWRKSVPCRCLSPFNNGEPLHLRGSIFTTRLEDDIENTEWLELLLPFTAVKNLYLSKQFSPRIAPALQELTGGRTTEVLPALQNVLLEGFQPSEPVQEGIAQFISARQLTNHPVAISVWDRDLVGFFLRTGCTCSMKTCSQIGVRLTSGLRSR